MCTRSPASLFIGRLTSVPQIDVRRTDCRHSRCSERASIAASRLCAIQQSPREASSSAVTSNHRCATESQQRKGLFTRGTRTQLNSSEQVDNVCWWNVGSDGEALIVGGRSMHARAAATGEAWLTSRNSIKA